MPEGFPPVADERSRVLILGSMPGEESLRKGEYYGNPRNHFWRLLYGMFGDGEPDGDYEARLAYALEHQVALWDVLSSCEREGSLDARIRRPEANDFGGLLRRCPWLEHVFFNGAAAEKLFRAQGPLEALLTGQAAGLRTNRLTFNRLPSSSPAMTMPFERKLEAWRMVRAALC